MKHILFIRFYFTNDKIFESYLEPFKKYFVSSLQSQTNKNFILNLYHNEKHSNIIKSLLKNIDYINLSYKEYKNFISQNNIEIQTRHDADDWMAEGYINKIQNLWNLSKEKYNDLIIHSQPKKYIVKEEKYSKIMNYNHQAVSMHSSLCIKNNIKNIGIYDCKHADLGRFSNNIIKIENYTKWIIHDNNITIKKHQSEFTLD